MRRRTVVMLFVIGSAGLLANGAHQSKGHSQPDARVVVLPAARGTAMAFAPDSRVLATASHNGSVRLWDIAAGAEKAVLLGQHGTTLALAFAPNGKVLASAGTDKVAKLWDVTTNKLLHSLQLPPLEKKLIYSPQIETLTFAPDGKTLAAGVRAGARDGYAGDVAVLWDIATGREQLLLHGLIGFRPALAFTPDGAAVAVATMKPRGVKIAQFPGGKEIRILRRPDGEVISSLAVAQAYNRLAIGVSKGGPRVDASPSDVVVCDWTSGRQLGVLSGHTGIINAVAFSTDGKILASGSADRTLRLWDAAAGKELVVLDADAKSVGNVAFSPDGETIATAGDDGVVKLWNVAKCLKQN